MLLARAPRDASVATASALRGVFAVNDAWLATGDLCRRDNDGDHWLVDHVSGLVRTANGPIATVPVEDALMSVPAVDLAAAYGLTSAEGGHELLIVAVTLRNGARLDIDDVAHAVAGLDAASRPNVVRVVDAIPHTTWYRLMKAPLRAEGLVVSSRAKPVWYREAATGTWVKLTAAARRETVW
jgi:putative long chain acyl-CoA synthase